MSKLLNWGIGALAAGSMVAGACAKDGGEAAKATAKAEAATPVAAVEAAPAEVTPETAAKASAQTPQEIHQLVDGLIRAVDGTPELAAINALEAKFAGIQADILRPMTKGFIASDAAAIQTVLGQANWVAGAAQKTRTNDGIVESRWALNGQGEDTLSGYLAGFTKIEDAKFHAVDLQDIDGTSVVSVTMDIRGLTATGRRNDRGVLSLTVAKADAGWTVARVTGATLDRLEASRAPSFEDITAKAQLAGVEKLTRTEAIRRGGYALAVSDFDGDLDPDVLLGSAGAVQLFRNDKGVFTDITKESGLRGETYVKSAAFVDLDNDGHKDLVLMRFVEDKGEEGDTLVYRNTGEGTFELKANVITASREYDRAMPLAVADFDNNGYLDLYLGFPGLRDFTNSLDLSPRDKDLAEQGLWLNQGDFKFSEETEKSKLLAGDKPVYPHSTLVTDLNGDGHQDLLVIDDSGQTSPVYMNDGTGVFTHVAEKSGIKTTGFGMSAAAGDFDGDGDIDVAVTQLGFQEAGRIWKALGRTDSPEAKKMMDRMARTMVGTHLYSNRGDGTFENVTEKTGVAMNGDATAGINFVDYNHDGHLDMYVTNGLWSGADGGENDMTSLFVRMMLRRDLMGAEGAGELADAGMAPPMARGMAANPVLRMVREFKGDYAAPAAGATSENPTLTFSGYERNRLMRNNGDGTFTEVGYLEGADRIEDGYVVAAADYDGDGKQDLLLRHCDRAPGMDYVPVTLLRNTRTDRQAVTVFAQGDASNHDGIGTVITATIGDQRLVREIQATAGAVQGEPTAYFGLAESDIIDTLEVRWPSGKVESFTNVKAGKFLMREGKGLTELAGI